MNKRGIVVDIRDDEVTLLTPEGNLVFIERTAPVRMGQEVVITKQPPRAWKRLVSWLSSLYRPVVGIAILLLGLIFFSPDFNTPTHAKGKTIFIDSQSSLEIKVDENDRVVQVRPVNASAEQVMDKIDWKEKPAEQFIIEYLQSSKKLGHLRKGETVVLTYTGTMNPEIIPTKDPNLSSIHLRFVEIPDEIENELAKHGTTPSRLLLVSTAKKHHIPLSINQVKDSPIQTLLDEKPVLVQAFDSPPRTKSEWLQLLKDMETPSTEICPPVVTDTEVQTKPATPATKPDKLDKPDKERPKEKPVSTKPAPPKETVVPKETTTPPVVEPSPTPVEPPSCEEPEETPVPNPTPNTGDTDIPIEEPMDEPVEEPVTEEPMETTEEPVINETGS